MIKQSKNIFFIVGILFFIYVSIGYIYFNERKTSLLNKKYTELATEMKHHLKTLIDEKSDAVLLLSIAISQNSEIKEVIKRKDLNILRLKNISQSLHKNSPLKNIWFHLLDSKGVSLYKSWSDKRGESILSVRKDIAKMIQNPKIITTISTGKFNITFKSIVPIYDDGIFIGMIETIARFNSIALKMQTKGYKSLLLVDKTYKDQLKYALIKKFVEGYYVATQDINETIITLFKQRYHEKLLNIDNYLLDTEHNLLLTTYHIKDIDTNEMGYFIISKSLDDVDFSDIDKALKNIILALSFMAFFVLVLLYYLYVIKYKKFIEELNEKLEEDVAFKTKELYHRAHHDALTELPNRTFFIEKLTQALRLNQTNFYVLFLDLDRFKEVNDTYGHDVGDTLLKMVTQRLQQSVREQDTIARLGGDEFTILIEDVTHDEMEAIAQTILLSMEETFVINGVKLYTTFSIGISHYPDDATTVEDLLKDADIAMYQAKSDGKNAYKFYSQEMATIAQQRVELEQDIKSALINGEFEAYFQPKVDATTLKVVGLEALIRWNHPKKGLIFPDKFIGFAEEIGVIVEIDTYMKREVLRITKGWLDKGLDFGKVSFNASTIELESEDFVKHLEALLKEFNYDSAHLELEVLESQSMRNKEKMKGILNEVKDLGVSVSIDDFGTGYSSLSYLKQLPIDKLKIDRSFIIDIPDDKASVALVSTIITLAQNFDLEIIAEGAETRKQVEFLVQKGCKNIQGYYFSKPIDAQALEKVLRDGLDKELRV